MNMIILARVLLLSFLCFIALGYAQSSSDEASMQALKASLTLPRDLDWSDADPCNWTGLKCDKSNRISRIQLSNKGISGTLPPHLKNLTSLMIFEVMVNNLTGAFPSLAGFKSLERVNIHDNGFTSFPEDFFTSLNSLQIVTLDNNPFGSWEIPLSLKDATALVEFSAVNCNIAGVIPDFLGGLTFPSLTTLHLSSNLLHGGLPLSFVGSPIQELWLNGQKGVEKLNGSISVLQNMTSLTEVWLQQNSFSGPIPDFSRLVSLANFSARDNQLTGVVPSSFTELQSLLTVSLSNNLLQGPIPIFKATKVQVELKGINSFCLDSPGTPCDPRVNTLLSIVEAFGYPVKLAENWKGNDPCDRWIGITCAGGNITIISFQNMGLTGTISPRFADLVTLQIINLSHNNLSGTIPEELTRLSNLKTFDVSFNQLYGKVPDFKPNVVDTSGNPNIGKDGPPSTPSPGNSGKNAGKTVGLIIGIVILLLLIGFVCFFLVKKKKQYHKMQYENGVLVHPQRSPDQDSLKITLETLCGNGSDNGLSGDLHMVEAGNIVISIQVLRDATDNFNEKNVLGRGGFGTVYKGELLDGTIVAVKRMESSIISGKGLDEFKSEIAVLTKVRHRNLVSLHGYCLEDDERLLVYQYMPQGTLSRHLFHWQEEGLEPLEWTKRLIIALDVGRGVEYLHTLAHQSFIHRDLKPSNILLGDDMRAKVADFGLVRLAPDGKQSIETRIAGTFGYLAPEYAVTGRVTTKVDVYSFGVILMELLTGRKALDEKRSEEDAHLATWFRRMFINKDSFLKAIDETIEVNEDTLGSINKVAELASYCSAREPQQRPEMSYVVTVLVSLVEQWKPSSQSENSEDGYGIDNDAPDPEVLRRWRELAGSSASGHYGVSFSSSSMGETSIPSRPSELDNTFKSEQGR